MAQKGPSNANANASGNASAHSVNLSIAEAFNNGAD